MRVRSAQIDEPEARLRVGRLPNHDPRIARLVSPIAAVSPGGVAKAGDVIGR
jgi:hypothetical protein